jgi:predicted HTH transcriptional regulator
MIHLKREIIPVDVLEEIVTLGEGYKTEFKATLPAPLAVAKTICAFSNTKGGNIFVGINDTGMPIGVINKDYELNKLEKALPILLPNPGVLVKVLTYKNSEIILIEVREGSEKPYYVKTGQTTQAYVRAGPVNLPANKRTLKNFLVGQGKPADGEGKGGILRKNEKIVFSLFEQNKQLSISQIKETLNYSERRVTRILEALARRGFLLPSMNEKNVYCRTRDPSR